MASLRGSRFVLVALIVASCGGDDASTAGSPLPATATPSVPGKSDVATPASTSASRDIVSTDLVLDLTTRTGRATLTLETGSLPPTFEVGDLRIDAVSTSSGTVVGHSRSAEGHLVVDVTSRTTKLIIEYGFSKHGRFDGWDATPGFTFLWPDHCGNLFPCHSAPADGTTFSLEVLGVPEGQTAVYPREVPAAAPAYQLGIAVGPYLYESLGTTPSGTEVGVYFTRATRAAALTGASRLPEYFAFLEQTLGDYLYGETVASVAVDWGPGDFGGLEHHPFWHIDDGQIGDPYTHAHEAAHGWFGGAVRIACWEDFVLSEGTATYLAARAIEAVDGPTAGAALWQVFGAELLEMIETGDDTVAWLPDTCNAISIAEHPLWSLAVYYRGAFFLRAVEAEVGRVALDATLAELYRRHGGASAAGVSDLLDLIEDSTGFDPSDLATRWLLSTGAPPGL